jgi:hypothetical protein
MLPDVHGIRHLSLHPTDRWGSAAGDAATDQLLPSPYMGMQASRIAGRPLRIGGVPGGEPSGAGMRPNFPSQ